MGGIRLVISVFILTICGVGSAMMATVVPMSKATPEPKFFAEMDKLSSALTVRYKPKADTQMRVIFTGQKADDMLSCKFILDHEKFKEKAKWNPLPIYLMTPGTENGKVSPVFEEYLEFPDGVKEANDQLIQFGVKFEKGDYKFQSLWRITPIVKVNDDGVATCEAVTEVCPSSELVVDARGKYSCKRKEGFAWINRITALPDLTAWVTQKLEIISGLVAAYVSKKDDGTLVAVEKPIS